MTSCRSLTDFEGLPGFGLVRRGIHDLASATHSAEACLVRIASMRMGALGLRVEASASSSASSAHEALYSAVLASGVADPYHRYNALCRELDSFMEAASALRRRQARAG